jgi:protein-tyrosine phosphatase
MKKVLFVCLGNICRSPMAEGIFQHKIFQLGKEDQWAHDSAGTSSYHIGDQPDPRTLDTLSEHGITFQHAARQVSSDANRFDYIIAMDHSNYADLKSILPADFKGLYLMRDFDPVRKGADVPDPYYGGKDGFENVYQMLDRSMDELIKFIEKNS